MPCIYVLIWKIWSTYNLSNRCKFQKNVQEHLPVGIPLHLILHRVQPPLTQEQAPSDLGQVDSQRTHQKTHWSGHPVLSPRDNGHQCLYELHHLSGRPQKGAGNQAALLGDDHQKRTWALLFSWRNTSPSRCRCWTTKMWGVDSEPLTTNPPRVWSRSSVRCPWDSTKAGTKFNLTSQTSLAEPTALTTSRPCECRFMQTAEFEGSTFRIDCTARRNYLPNSSSSSPFRNNNECLYPVYIHVTLLPNRHYLLIKVTHIIGIFWGLQTQQ